MPQITIDLTDDEYEAVSRACPDLKARLLACAMRSAAAASDVPDQGLAQRLSDHPVYTEQLALLRHWQAVRDRHMEALARRYG
jgi:hypothetical protein